MSRATLDQFADVNPLSEVFLLVNFAKDRTKEKARLAAEGVLNLEGYGFHYGIAVKPLIGDDGQPVEDDGSTPEEYCNALIAGVEIGQPLSMGKLDWSKIKEFIKFIVPLILPLILEPNPNA